MNTPQTPAGALRTLVLGGARSGKSHWAEQQFSERADVDYVATSASYPDDPEWSDRVTLHRARRPDGWRTLETLDLVGVLGTASSTPVLIDCLTLWLTRTLDGLDAWTTPPPQWRDGLDRATDALVGAVAGTNREVIMVSNEVGWGVVPDTPEVRMFRDELGRLNTRVAAECERVVLCVAGIPLQVR
ncbi:bifunctional adenosylcobinamide kinase/adenosylcobinamide-phosphate guanylyltransferase [Propionibacteriaceae bacterium G1746]|uniref:bifunctional adenosylcobinamide kinase/adenosylcobinamide-phosphate guanylyltransferase n=1 Tax=Aestuariimicrobium sp. G57 TaxID=3418485 RepID=UPI003C23F968